MTDKMLEHTKAQLSALFDGELGRDEARFLRKRLDHDTDLAACVSRWQLAGDILRGQATAAAPAGFAGRVAVAIAAADGDTGNARAAAPAARSRRWIPGAALAASVAVVAMFMARQAPDVLPSDNAAPVEIASTTPAPAVPAEPVAPAPEPAAPQAPDAAAQLAVAAVAAVEVPRRAAARREGSSRRQAQRAAATRATRTVQAEPALVAVNETATQAASQTASPFTPDAAASPRPWPRAILPNAGGAFNVGYGSMQAGGFPADAHPFRPAPAHPDPSPR